MGVTREEWVYLVATINLGAWVVCGALLLAIVCWRQALRSWRVMSDRANAEA